MRVRSNPNVDVASRFAGSGVKVLTDRESGAMKLDWGMPPMDSRWGELCGWHKDAQDIRDNFDKLSRLMLGLSRQPGMTRRLKVAAQRLVYQVAAFSTVRVPADADSRKLALRQLNHLFGEADRLLKDARRQLDVQALTPTARAVMSESTAQPAASVREEAPGEVAPSSARTSTPTAATGHANTSVQSGPESQLPPHRNHDARSRTTIQRPSTSQPADDHEPMDATAIRDAVETALESATQRGGKLMPYGQRLLAGAICSAFGGQDKSHTPHRGTYDSDARVQHVIRNLRNVLTQDQRNALNALLKRDFPDHGLFVE